MTTQRTVEARKWMRLPPLLASIGRGYRREWIVADVVTGLLVVTIAIPLSIGMAEVAGVDPVVGLYTCLFPAIGYALLGSSRHLVLGLDASTAALVAATVGPIAAGDPQRYLALANVLALVVGAICLLAGFLRVGIIAELLSSASLLGYQAGLALTVTVNQLPRLWRVPTVGDETTERISGLLRSLDDIHGPSLAVGAGVLLFVLAAHRLHPHVPAALGLLAVASLIVDCGWLGSGVQLIGAIPSGAPPVGWPAFSARDFVELLPAGFAIALVASADTLASSEAFAVRNNYSIDPNRELAGLGAANAIAGLSGGIPASASAARTAVAESTGAHTPLASIVAALAMLAVLTTLTRPLEMVPLAALAGVVIAAIIRLIDVRAFVSLWHERRTDFVLAITVGVAVIVVGVLVALALALGVALLGRLIERKRQSASRGRRAA